MHVTLKTEMKVERILIFEEKSISVTRKAPSFLPSVQEAIACLWIRERQEIFFRTGIHIK
jgi:hypothetical protein